ncbi:MAG TPA: hypothetical protein VEX38_09320, partial [Fimbriimonadaceae bacterium]|nr:hypothetical protein [Fimbriimonadaceae bacterium]
MSLRLSALALCLTPGLAIAQADLTGAASTMVDLLRERGRLPANPPRQDPLEPSGFPGLPPREGALPAPRPFDQRENTFEIVDAGKSRFVGSKVYATGGLHARYKGYDIFGTELEGDTQEEIFTLTGDVKVLGNDAVIQGERVTVNFKNQTFRAENSDVQLRPSFFRNRVLDDVYTRGAQSYGTRREVFTDNGALTTCNLDHPHYEILSRSTTVRPSKRMILRDVVIRILNKNILKIPYLSIPLEEQSERYLPEVGNSPDEGYFIKSRIPIGLRGNTNFLDARVDYMTKLGNGLGAEYFYGSDTAGVSGAFDGYLRAYGIVGRTRTLDLQTRHVHRLGTTEVSLENNYQRQNYLNAPQNTLLDSRLQIAIPQSLGSSTVFSFYRNSNDSFDFRNLQQTFNLTDSRFFSPFTRTVTDLAYSVNSSSFGGGEGVERKQADVRFRGTHDLRKALAELEYQRSIPIGDTTNFFSSADRTPVFYLRSDAARLVGRNWASELPFTTELSLGELSDPATQSRIGRGTFDFGLAKPDRGERRYGLGIDGRYRQGIYSDDTAQYILNFNSVARYDFGRDTGANVRYSYLQPHGYTPLQIDRTGRTNLATADVYFEPLRTFRIGAQTGYDFILEQQQEVAWQSVGVRTEW